MSSTFAKVHEDKRFVRSAKMAIEHAFFPDPTWFRGDEETLDKLLKMDRAEYASILLNHPFAYFSVCEKADDCEMSKDLADQLYKTWTETPYDDWKASISCHLSKSLTVDMVHIYCCIRQDNETRQELIDKAKDKNCMEWWTFIHNCETQAVFLTYPALKILYPEMKFYLVSTGSHVFITNTNLPPKGKVEIGTDLSKPTIFDPIGQSLNDLEWYEDDAAKWQVFDEEQMIPWFIKNYVIYDGCREEILKILAWQDLWR